MHGSLHATWSSRLDQLLRRYRRWSPTVMRLGVGSLYLWFGALKLVPGLSPVDDLATHSMRVMTFGLVPDTVSRSLLALMEILIGTGLVTRLFFRATLATFFVHMTGVMITLALLPHEVWAHPFVPTLNGQYILKNLVLIAACLHLAAVELTRTRPAPVTAADARPSTTGPGPEVLRLEVPRLEVPAGSGGTARRGRTGGRARPGR